MRMKRKYFQAVLILAVLAGMLPLPAENAPGRQNTDPFYIKSLRDGETLYQARRYKEAAESLEIAAFGLFSRKDTLARTRVYLTLCYAYLNDRAKAEQNLNNARTILGLDGLLNYELPEAVRADWIKILRIFKVDSAPPPAPAAPNSRSDASPAAKTPAPKPTPADSSGAAAGSGAIDSLKEAIRRTPRQADLYRELVRLQIEAKDPSGAKDTLHRLLENNPAEIQGHLELGRLAYGERSLREAEKSLEKFLSLKASITIDRRLIVEAEALLALSAFLRGDREKARTALKEASELADPEYRDKMNLSAEDRERLARLLQR